MSHCGCDLAANFLPCVCHRANYMPASSCFSGLRPSRFLFLCRSRSSRNILSSKCSSLTTVVFVVRSPKLTNACVWAHAPTRREGCIIGVRPTIALPGHELGIFRGVQGSRQAWGGGGGQGEEKQLGGRQLHRDDEFRLLCGKGEETSEETMQLVVRINILSKRMLRCARGGGATILIPIISY